MIRLLLVEDDPRQAAGLEAVIRRAPDLSWAGHCASVAEALRTVDFSRVDVLLTDLDLGEEPGVALIAAVATLHPHVISLPHSVHDNRESLFAALRAGARGYLVKGAPAEQLLAGVRAAAKGEAPMSPAVARYLIEEFRGTPPPAPAGDERLSARELEILRHVAGGMLYKEIADRLGISPHTVHNHLKNVYAKLHAAGREQAVRTAVRLGYLVLERDGNSAPRRPA